MSVPGVSGLRQLLIAQETLTYLQPGADGRIIFAENAVIKQGLIRGIRGELGGIGLSLLFPFKNSKKKKTASGEAASLSHQAIIFLISEE